LRRLATGAAVAADGRRGAWRPGTFARVLADVPCSGLGALRRRPEARWRKSPEDVEGLVPLQRDLLTAAIDSAGPGGVVGYVTCSPHQAETEGVVRDVLAARDDVSVLDAPAVLAGALGHPVPGVSRGPGGRYVQFWPHRHGTDALFLALLRRDAVAKDQEPKK
jgi:16S rRNA (cytosine967-C5)-methyltransferase